MFTFKKLSTSQLRVQTCFLGEIRVVVHERIFNGYLKAIKSNSKRGMMTTPNTWGLKGKVSHITPAPFCGHHRTHAHNPITWASIGQQLFRPCYEYCSCLLFNFCEWTEMLADYLFLFNLSHPVPLFWKFLVAFFFPPIQKYTTTSFSQFSHASSCILVNLVGKLLLHQAVYPHQLITRKCLHYRRGMRKFPRINHYRVKKPATARRQSVRCVGTGFRTTEEYSKWGGQSASKAGNSTCRYLTNGATPSKNRRETFV